MLFPQLFFMDFLRKLIIFIIMADFFGTLRKNFTINNRRKISRHPKASPMKAPKESKKNQNLVVIKRAISLQWLWILLNIFNVGISDTLMSLLSTESI